MEIHGGSLCEVGKMRLTLTIDRDFKELLDDDFEITEDYCEQLVKLFQPQFVNDEDLTFLIKLKGLDFGKAHDFERELVKAFNSTKDGWVMFKILFDFTGVGNLTGKGIDYEKFYTNTK